MSKLSKFIFTWLLANKLKDISDVFIVFNTKQKHKRKVKV